MCRKYAERTSKTPLEWIYQGGFFVGKNAVVPLISASTKGIPFNDEIICRPVGVVAINGFFS
jgi:hypothetical protein